MGFDNRHYARGGGWQPNVINPRGRGRGGGGFRDWEVWKQIIALNVAVFLLQILITRPATEDDYRLTPYFDDMIAEMEYLEEFESGTGSTETDESVGLDQRRREMIMRQLRMAMPQVSVVQQWFQLDTEKVLDGQLWRLVTAGFCHDRQSLMHLLFNMLFLFWFGRRLESQYGSREFLAFYATGLVFSSLTYLVVDYVTDTNVPAIGASGAVWSVIAVYALLYPYERVYVYFLFPVEIRFLVLLYFVFDLHPLLLMLAGQPSTSGVAHAAHVGGAIFGFLYWYNGWRMMPIYEDVIDYCGSLLVQPRQNVSPSGTIRIPTGEVTPVTPGTPGTPGTPSAAGDRLHDKERINDQMQTGDSLASEEDALDRILNKITREGKESLSDEELEVLEKTSRELRKQRPPV